MQSSQKLLPGTLQELSHLGDKYLLVKVKTARPYTHKPGQYCFIQYHDDEGTFSRPYSIASQPRDDGIIEFCMVKTGDNRTTMALNRLEVGDAFLFTPASGQFHFPKPQENATFIAGGSGIAPLRSMILDRYLNARPSTKIGRSHLLFGCEKSSEIPYFEELQALSKQESSFEAKFFAHEDLSSIRHAQVEAGLPTEHLKNAVFPDHDYFLCGPPPMIDRCREILLENGIKESRIFKDQY